MQIDRKTKKWIYREADRDRQVDRQVKRQTQANRYGEKQTQRQPGRQTNTGERWWDTPPRRDRQANRHYDTQLNRQADRQTAVTSHIHCEPGEKSSHNPGNHSNQETPKADNKELDDAQNNLVSSNVLHQVECLHHLVQHHSHTIWNTQNSTPSDPITSTRLESYNT